MTAFVVYLATCNRCKGQYVGKSVTLFEKRHSNHKQDIKKGLGGIGQHYGGSRACSYADISLVENAGVNISQNFRILHSGKVSYFEGIREEFPNFVHRAQCHKLGNCSKLEKVSQFGNPSHMGITQETNTQSI